VAVNPLPVFPAAIYNVGLTAHVASGRRNERAMTAGLKTLAYADGVAAWLEARRAGADEALFRTSRTIAPKPRRATFSCGRTAARF
jgi:branched-subunit amino acid aminotransferase/4-amino-4-deoxychorismate lyase